MFDKNHLESLLKINGIEKSAPDEEIRSVLLSARFKNDEVDTALMILRENTQTKQTRVEGLHKVFRTDSGLKPSEISDLLGIEVNIEDSVIVAKKKSLNLSLLQFVLLWVVSLVFAVIAVLLYMYSNDMGIFRAYPSYASYEQNTQ
jgi:hypothetical protein